MNRDPRTSDFFVAGGTLHPDSPSYVERPADNELFNLVLAGDYCYVLTPRQMGKSSLMVRTAQRLEKQGIRTAIIDLTEIDTVEADTWYLDLITELTRALRLSVDPEAWWQTRDSLGHTRRFTNFLRDVALTEIKNQVVIFIDEIDSTLRLEFSDDFFAAIRAMYNARSRDSKFERLNFVLLGVASPPDLIKDRTRTPFNIGQGIILKDFSRIDAAVLQAELEAVHPGHGEAIFARIHHWTGGHPYLTQKICQAMAKTEDGPWPEERIDELVEELFLSKEASKEANLKFVRDRILTHPQQRQLLGIYRKVYKGKRITDDEQSPLQNHLKLAGLVKAEDGYLQVRNEIYRRAFDLAWVRENTAVNWAPIVAGIAVFVALLAIGSILHDAWWLGIQFQNCVANFYQTNLPEERVAHLAKIFRLQGLVLPTDYDYRARELFYGLSREEQLALFSVNDLVEDSNLIVLIRGLYVTLADTDGTDSTRPFLEAMANALGDLDAAEEAEELEVEINSWLRGRKLAKQNRYADALVEYNKAIELNSENPATLYERAGVLTELPEYQQALRDLDQVVAIARRAPAPTPTAPPITTQAASSSPTTEPTTSPGLTPTSTSTPSVDITPSEISPPVSVTIASTSLPISTETPTPAPITSEFVTIGQIINAIRNLIYGDEDLGSSLVSAPSSEYPNLREFGLVPTHLYKVPTLVVRYFPVKNGRLDVNVTGDVNAPLEDIRRHTVETTERVIQALETGSTYHGYKDPTALSSLRYQIVHTVEFLEPLPTYKMAGHQVPMTDYNAVMDRLDIRHWVEERGVKEVWLWSYHGGGVDIWPSNMAGPYGDISNSYRDPTDLPVLSQTYTVYHYNYKLGPSEAVEAHLHQIESVLKHVDYSLFWDKFVGQPGAWRCGWAHYPPNGEHDYDWANPKDVWTDIEDWTPEGTGQKKHINCTTWNCNSLDWFIYWMQNLPGANNGLTYQGRPLINWWAFIGDFDGTQAAGLGLVGPR